MPGLLPLRSQSPEMCHVQSRVFFIPDDRLYFSCLLILLYFVIQVGSKWWKSLKLSIAGHWAKHILIFYDLSFEDYILRCPHHSHALENIEATLGKLFLLSKSVVSSRIPDNNVCIGSFCNMPSGA